MKKLFSILIAAGGALSAAAQTPGDNTGANIDPNPHKYKDANLPRWVLDVNFVGGVLMQDFTTKNTMSNYLDVIAEKSNTGGSLKLTNGINYGGDVQLGFFFGKKRHFGLGTGFMYLRQEGDATWSDNFKVQYKSFDANNDVFRQVITSTDRIQEKLEITNLNIPVVLKYKARLSKVFGFTMDAGALINFKNSNSYTSNAKFDYEAIYKFDTTGGVRRLVYDNAPNYNVNDQLYLKSEYLGAHDAAYVNNYFNNTLASRGYNVGLGKTPGANTGTVSYNTVSIGLLVQPSVNIFLSDAVALNVGGYYIYQPFENDAKANYKMTDKVGDYSSSLNTVSSVASSSYGANVGLRFFFGKAKDTDHDGVPDKNDKCPTVFGLPQFMGCPDTDGDGIADTEDSCVTVPGIVKFHGCPDSDGDGIADKNDACPFVAGKAEFHGCPDRDGDGIIDKDDLCPDKAGSKAFQGCPDTDGDGIPDNTDRCPDVAGPADNNGCPYPTKPAPEADQTPKVSSPILFEVNKTVIEHSSMPTLEEAVRLMNADKNSVIVVNGYTDITGKPAYNKTLSLKRANAVKAQLIKMGVKASRIKVVGHGSKDPAQSNDTIEGRMRNRRAVMQLNVGS